MDWNGDGKQDWQDDALFHNVINGPSGGGGDQPSGTPRGCGCSTMALIVLILAVVVGLLSRIL